MAVHVCAPQGVTIGPRTNTIWSGSIDAGVTYISLPNINEIVTALNKERAVRSLGSTPSIGDTYIYKEDFTAIRTAINECRSRDGLGAFTYNHDYSSYITDFSYKDFRSFVNVLESTCVCQCNYCTCNCNYCTCNCNYCTCNCNYNCTCNCNYCNCNYQCSCDGHSGG